MEGKRPVTDRGTVFSSVSSSSVSSHFPPRLGRRLLSVTTFFFFLVAARCVPPSASFDVRRFPSARRGMTTKRSAEATREPSRGRDGGGIGGSAETEEAAAAAASSQGETAATAAAAPMYITVGPQCCGKSSFLRNLGNNDGGRCSNNVRDVCLDDQPDVYVPVPTECVLQAVLEGDSSSSSSSSCADLLDRVYHGKSLLERIREGVEMVQLLRRWNGELAPAEFERLLVTHYLERNLPPDVARNLASTVEALLSKSTTSDPSPPPGLPETVDVYVSEALFRPHPDTGRSGIQKGHDMLRDVPLHVPVAWGNTNSRPSDYSEALQVACQKGRPVRFVLCHPLLAGNNDDVDGGNVGASGVTTLPWVPLEGLLRRNLLRFAATGRYVPASAVADCCQRVGRLVPPHLLGRRAGHDLEMERHLVALASPPPSRGPRRPDGNNNNNNDAAFEFFLTDRRTIQKRQPGRGNNEAGGRGVEGGRPDHHHRRRPPPPPLGNSGVTGGTGGGNAPAGRGGGTTGHGRPRPPRGDGNGKYYRQS